MRDLRPSIEPALALFGLPAVVTISDGEPVATTAIWLPPVSVEAAGVLLQTDRPQAVLAVPLAGLPFSSTILALPTVRLSSLLRGMRIDAAEKNGGPVLSWMVETVLGVAVDEIRVMVIPAQSA